MRVSGSLFSSLLLFAAGAAEAASSWAFDDATLSVTSRKGGDGLKEKLSPKAPLSKAVTLGSTDSLKIILTAKEGGTAKRPHQAFLLLQDAETGLEAPFPLTVKDSGKGVVSVAYKDIPVQLLASSKPIHATIVLASFGSSQGVLAPLFDLQFKQEPNTPVPSAEVPLRYTKQPEIRHTFRADPRSPPKIISLFFSVIVAATVPALFIGWSILGGNLNHLQKAMGAAPLSHLTFFGSILTMEGIFFMYYSGWNLFRVLPLIAVVGFTTFLSGTKALGEVQSRRLAGER